jgi:hypothetical protein
MANMAFYIGLVLCASLFAMMEIQIEGADGWAAQLPTWRIENRWTRLFFGKRPLTGYHLYVLLFVLLMAHAPYFLAMAVPSWRGEARVVSFIILFWVLEDFLWFAFNPRFGVGKFRKEHIWWHASNWWWIMPRDYWIFVPVGLLLFYVSRGA